MDEELEVQEEVVLEHLPEAVLQDIICISGWLVEYGRNQGMDLFLLLSVSLKTAQLQVGGAPPTLRWLLSRC